MTDQLPPNNPAPTPAQDPYGQQPYGQPNQQPQPVYGQPDPTLAQPPMQPMYMAPPPAPKKKAPRWLIAVVVLVVLVVCGGIGIAAAGGSDKTKNTTSPISKAGAKAGSQTTKAPPTTPAKAADDTQNMKMGDTITSSDDDNSMDVTVNKVTYRASGCGSNDFGMSDPEKGDAYVIIDVTYEVTKGVGSYNPLDWSVVTTGGDEYDDMGFLAGCKPELSSSNSLRSKRHGLVAVEVKKGVTHGQVVYSTALGEESASWKF